MKPFLFAVACVATMLANQSNVLAQSTRESFAESYRYEKTQNYADAIKALTPLQTASPDDYIVNLRLGWLQYLNGKYANSLRHYQAAIKSKPNAAEPKIGYMLPMLAQARYADAEAVARQVITIDPKNYYANLRLAYALRWQAKFAQAEQVGTNMLALYPTDISFLTEVALARLGQKKTAAANELFQTILLLDPENVTAKQQLGLNRPKTTSTQNYRYQVQPVSQWYAYPPGVWVQPSPEPEGRRFFEKLLE